MTATAISDWQKGGVRYAKLKERVPEALAPSSLETFFVAVRGKGGPARLLNPLSPLQREYVIALTSEDVVVLRLKRPGVFRASIAGKIFETPRDEAGAQWRDGSLALGGVSYQPISFHDQDAEELAGLLGA